MTERPDERLARLLESQLDESVPLDRALQLRLEQAVRERLLVRARTRRIRRHGALFGSCAFAAAALFLWQCRRGEALDTLSMGAYEPTEAKQGDKVDTPPSEQPPSEQPTPVELVATAVSSATPAPSASVSQKRQGMQESMRHARSAGFDKTSTTLAEQNELLTRAVQARRAGRSHEALELYTQLLRRYPHGPLAETALAERMKLLSALDPKAASAAAREYLKRFPQGPAAGRARKLTQGASP